MKRIGMILCGICILMTGCQLKESQPELLGLEWYSDPKAVKAALSAYQLEDEYEEVSPGGVKQTLLEYEDVTLYGHICEELVLCFTSSGLVGVNYHDADGTYTEWQVWLTEKFGEPSDSSESTAVWEDAPADYIDMIYLMDWDGDVQISFFVNDETPETETTPPAETLPSAAGKTPAPMPAVAGLEFYADMEQTRQAMGASVLEETETTGAGGVLQTLLEYDNVSLYGQPCDVTLCFTSLGLVGINYHDAEGDFLQWQAILEADYGTPTQQVEGMAGISESFCTWENDPLGIGTSIYLFAQEDEVQISFFADDTGSAAEQ